MSEESDSSMSVTSSLNGEKKLPSYIGWQNNKIFPKYEGKKQTCIF